MSSIVRTIYRDYIIDTDDLGRIYIYYTKSRYSENCDHILVDAERVWQVKDIIDARSETGEDYRSYYDLPYEYQGRLIIQHINGWKYIWYFADHPTPFISRYFCTNDDGDGVFCVDLKRNTRDQILGTCQFSVAGLKDPRAKIRRYVNRY